jgi:hypothetical protein
MRPTAPNMMPSRSFGLKSLKMHLVARLELSNGANQLLIAQKKICPMLATQKINNQRVQGGLQGAGIS